jgi:hypothetical protein
MAVPSAVTQRRERDADAMRAQGINPDTGMPLDAPPTEGGSPSPAPLSPSAAPAAVPTDDAAALRARVQELEAELSTQNGRTSSAATELNELKARFDVINDNRSFLERTVTELSEKATKAEQQLAEMSQNKTAESFKSAVSTLDGDGPTDKQKEEFGDSLDFVQRVVRQQLAAVIKPLAERMATLETVLGRVKDIDAKLPTLERAAQVTDLNVQRDRELEFLRAEILPHFTDFEQVRTTPAWKEYLNKDTGKGYKIGQLLASYRKTGDAVGIRTLLGAFYESRKAAPSLESLAVPGKTNAETPPAPAAAKMKSSEYKMKLKAMTSKKLSKPEWEEYRARWDAAVASGNVEMDEEVR